MTEKPWLKFYDKGVPESLKPYPEKPLQQFLEESAAKYPDHAAVQFKPSHQGFAKSHLTYRELNDLTDRMAAALADRGVKKGDRVAIFMPNIPQFIITFYGILKAGGVVVASNPTYTEPELASEEQLAAVIARISARPRRALVVDDDALMRRMLADALSARGFEALSAPDARTGLRTVMEELLSLDLLVTDLRMPGMDGEAFVRTIRQAGGETELAIVAAVGSLDPEAERRLEAAGCDAVLDKVLGPELLAQAADAALERKRASARA